MLLPMYGCDLNWIAIMELLLERIRTQIQNNGGELIIEIAYVSVNVMHVFQNSSRNVT